MQNTNEYKVVDLTKEYKGFVGEETHAVVTDLSEEELNSKYGDELNKFRPFVILSNEMYKVFTDSKRNDERERKRDQLYHDPSALEYEADPDNEKTDPALMYETTLTYEYIVNKMKCLPAPVGSRMYKRYILGCSMEEIAREEGVSRIAVLKSLEIGKEAIRKLFVECGVIE